MQIVGLKHILNLSIVVCINAYHRETCHMLSERARSNKEDTIKVLNFADLILLRHEPNGKLDWSVADLKYHFQIPDHMQIKCLAYGELTFRDADHKCQEFRGLNLTVSQFTVAFEQNLQKYGGTVNGKKLKGKICVARQDTAKVANRKRQRQQARTQKTRKACCHVDFRLLQDFIRLPPRVPALVSEGEQPPSHWTEEMIENRRINLQLATA